jgi:hypothetical protein
MTAQGTYVPSAAEQYCDANGNPAVDYRIFTYLAGTATKVNTYTDVALTIANQNPLTLGADARPTIMLTPGVSYKILLALPGTDDPPSSSLWSRDNIQAVPPSGTSADVDVTATAGENIAAGECCYLSAGAGGATAGRFYLADADNTYSSTDAKIIGFATAAISTGSAGTVRVSGRVTGLSGLVAGTVYAISATGGAVTSTAPTNARFVLQADSTTAGIVLTGEPLASATVPGVVGLVSQTLGLGTAADIKTVGGLVVNSTPTYKPGSDATADAVASGSLRALVDTTQHANSGTGNTVMSTMTLPAGTLATNGATAVFYFGGTYAANANNKTITFLFGATTVTLANGGANGGGWHVTVYVVRTGAATQKIIAFYGARPGGTGDFNAFATTAAETLSGAITVQTKSQSGTASSDILQEVFIPALIGA